MSRWRRTHDHEIIKNSDFDREVFCCLETELFHIKPLTRWSVLGRAGEHRCVQSRTLKLGNVPWFLATAMASTTGSRTTALRMRMIDAMVLRGFAERTQDAYVAAVRLLAEHHHSSPAVLSDEQVQGYLASTCCRRATCRARR